MGKKYYLGGENVKILFLSTFMSFSNNESVDMLFVYEYCNSSARAPKIKYRRRYPQRRLPSSWIISNLHRFANNNKFLILELLHLQCSYISQNSCYPICVRFFV